jgi:hypothetical protein
MVKMHKNGLKLLVWCLKLGCQHFTAQNRSNDTLGVELDSKLQWSKHISKTIKKAYKSLRAINKII